MAIVKFLLNLINLLYPAYHIGVGDVEAATGLQVGAGHGAGVIRGQKYDAVGDFGGLGDSAQGVVFGQFFHYGLGGDAEVLGRCIYPVVELAGPGGPGADAVDADVMRAGFDSQRLGKAD